MQINRWNKSLSFKRFVYKCNFMQLLLKINAIFSCSKNLPLVPMSAAARANEIEGAPAEYEGALK